VNRLARVAWGWIVLCVMAARCVGQSQAPDPMPAPAPGQPFTSVAPLPSARFPASWYPSENDVTTYGVLVQETDAPYTATMVTTSRLVDPQTGAVRESVMRTLQIRDAAGRTRTETSRPYPGPYGQVIQLREIDVNDPVSRCSFHWGEPRTNAEEPTATVKCGPLKAKYLKKDFAEGLVEQPTKTHFVDSEIFKEPLGKRVVNGVEATGVRVTETSTSPATGKVSKLVTEVWVSLDLREQVELKTAAEEGSTLSFDLTDIRREQPDEGLFYPPEGYRILVQPEDHARHTP
jgi:hypothetical protein